MQITRESLSAQRFKFWVRCPKCMINQISCIKSRVILTEKILTNITTTKSQIFLKGSWLIFTVNLTVFRRNKKTGLRLIREGIAYLRKTIPECGPYPGFPEWIKGYKTIMTSHVSLNPDSWCNVTNYNCPAQTMSQNKLFSLTASSWLSGYSSEKNN